MRRRAVAIGTVAALVAAAVIAFGFVAQSGDEEGRRAPDFSMPSLQDEGGTITLADFRGQPVVLNFWASWCVPCRKEMPALQRVSEATEGQVAFLGVNHQDGRNGANRLLEETGVSYPSVFDPGGGLAERYRLFGMPSTFFISADGHILEEHTGELTEDDLVARIERLFNLEIGLAPPLPRG